MIVWKVSWYVKDPFADLGALAGRTDSWDTSESNMLAVATVALFTEPVSTDEGAWLGTCLALCQRSWHLLRPESTAVAAHSCSLVRAGEHKQLWSSPTPWIKKQPSSVLSAAGKCKQGWHSSIPRLVSICTQTSHSPTGLLKSTGACSQNILLLSSWIHWACSFPTLSSCFVKVSRCAQSRQGTFFDYLALMAKRAEVAELLGTVTIRKTVLGRPLPPSQGNAQPLGWNTTPVFLWKKAYLHSLEL